MKALTFAAVVVASALVAPAHAQSLTKLTYLTAAPATLPAFAPFQIAKHKGYYRDGGLDVEFVAAKGGADVAKQIGVGNADLGGGIGDTPIIVRPNGLPVRGVALLGGGSLTQIVARKDAGINSPADLKGKSVTVLAYQDTTYYALLGVLAAFNLTKNDVDIQAAGPAGSIQLVAAGKAVAVAGVPERGLAVEFAGVPTTWFSAGQYFPRMSQAILASEDAIKNKPQMIRSFVLASLKGVRDIMSDPVQATKDFIAAAPENAGKEKEIEAILLAYNKLVYAGQSELGSFDPARLKAVQDFYLKAGIIEKGGPVEDLYTNEFIK